MIFTIVKNKQDTEDLIQDTFIKVYESIDDFSMRDNFKYWLLQIAKNKAKDFLKKKKVIINSDYIHSISDEKEAYEDFDSILDKYKKVINEEEYLIITLHLFHKMKFREIAVLYEKTTSSVNNIYARGIKKIKEYLKND